MFLHSNIKFLRNYTRTTQAEFGKLFSYTRSNIDSYERGNAKPPLDLQTKVSEHFNIPLEVLITKDLQMNPGLMFAGTGVNDQQKIANEDALRAKDETIKLLKQRCEFLEQQNAQLLKKIKVL